MLEELQISAKHYQKLLMQALAHRARVAPLRHGEIDPMLIALTKVNGLIKGHSDDYKVWYAGVLEAMSVWDDFCDLGI